MEEPEDKPVDVVEPTTEPAVSQDITTPNCPSCGQYMDKTVAYVCRNKCGELKE